MASLARSLPTGFGVAVVAAQIPYPLLSGTALRAVTIAAVALFFLASAGHAWVWRGPRWAAEFVVITVGIGWAVEAVGAATGVPFGDYAYADTLGPQLLEVPVVVPLAWSMMAYPALLIGRRLARSPAAVAVTAGVALASWDVFLDPQMVAAGHWSWSAVSVSLPGSPQVPVSNYLGWLLVTVVLMAVADRSLPRVPAGSHSSADAAIDDRLPYALYLWTWISSMLANVAFFGRPWVALTGGLAMGLVAVPLLVSLAGSHADPPADHAEVAVKRRRGTTGSA